MRLDVGWGRVEPLALGDGRATLVIGDEGLHVWRARDRDAFGLVRGDEHADRAIMALQVPRGDGLHRRGRDLFDAVARQEVQPPVTLGGPFAQYKSDLARVRCGQRTGLEALLLCNVPSSCRSILPR